MDFLDMISSRPGQPELKQKKSLGQVFLREDWPCKKIAEQMKSAGVESVIEIGPGKGILTRALLEVGIHVTAIERDERFAEFLRDFYQQKKIEPGHGRFQVIHEDVLAFDLGAWAQETHGKKAVCGNIPYYISSPIVMWLLPHLKELVGSWLLVQLEFAQRLAAASNTKDYGSLSVFTQLRAKTKLEFKVPKSAFIPPPKVDSAVVSLQPLAEMLPEELLKNVEKLTRKVFTQRRKMLSNSLGSFLQNKEPSSLPIKLNARCETLSPDEFVELAKALFPRES